VYPSGGQQPDDVHRLAFGNREINSVAENGISVESAIVQVSVDPGIVLGEQTAGTEVKVPNFRIAHLVDRQPNNRTRTAQLSMRTPL
jgi:hypothetical protein